MIKQEIRQQVKARVEESPEGISLTHLHNKFQSKLNRTKLRALLGALYKKGEITRERIHKVQRRETMYFPFNGKPIVKRVRKKTKERDKKMLSMKDFMPGKKYQAYIDF
jgi:hypothetical protein